MTEDEKQLVHDCREIAKIYEGCAARLEAGEDSEFLSSLVYGCGLTMGLAARLGVRFGETLERWAADVRSRGEPASSP